MSLTHRLGLASQSPRRLSLLKGVGFDIIPLIARAEPVLQREGKGAQQALSSALAKLPENSSEKVFLSADTVVHIGLRCLGKPSDAFHASAMLNELSGQAHEVTTGVAIGHPKGVVSFYVTRTVYFRALSDQEIERYVASGEPMDKAGAYGIQGLGAGLIESVEGSHTAVVGLPLVETVRALIELGVQPR